MQVIRELLEEKEKKTLSSHAALSSKASRKEAEEECELRTRFQKDRDKILHSKPFRRLKHKTQVFLNPVGDHYRTRMTHTLEVMQIGRTMARALHLNEDLVEAAALGHDLGHTPFGHSGEAILNKIHPKGFHHVFQSVRIVDPLNVTEEVREAIAKHSKGKGPILSDDPKLKAKTLEGQVVRLADIIAYVNHDLDDAIRAEVLTFQDIPKRLREIFGNTHSERIETMIKDVMSATQEHGFDKIRMSAEKLEALIELRAFMFNHIYETDRVQRELKKAQKMVESLYFYYLEHPDQLLSEISLNEFTDPIDQHVIDFISGMTDRYAINKYREIFLPFAWS
ncbi:MAG: deoxyguanosinetriphosphate triphosphohydrolase [Deltaproteobacteria bacterium]|nr:deoxyguanosinetriphosphate triphosphohydrolase [Deltaproteobacteria bacterium]